MGQIPINRPSYRFLTGYGSDEQQYRALMTAGATFAQSQQLRPGIALSPEQVALLTSDIVWLVEQSVTLPGKDGQPGSTTRALVPQVYAVPRPGDLDGSGTLMAALYVVDPDLFDFRPCPVAVLPR